MNSDRLATRIRYERFDLLVPFLCRKCGKRCRTYIPQFTERHMEEISDYLGIPFAVCFRLCRDRRRTGAPGVVSPCPFFSKKDRLCGIYPLRPDVCRLYPFSFGGGDLSCPEYRRHVRIVGRMTRGEAVRDVHDPSFCPAEEFRPVPPEETGRMVAKFLRAAHSGDLLREFLLVNRLSAPAVRGARSPERPASMPGIP
jgi:Fe-S-cluster containining protein